MSEKTNILYLCVCMALSDHKLDKTETAKIIEISKRLKVEFNVHEAAEEISKKFRDDLDAAREFYCGNIQDDQNRRLGKELFKEVAICNGEPCGGMVTRRIANPIHYNTRLQLFPY